MAILIPDSVFSDPDITLGERKTLRALRDGLDDDVLIWYEPNLEGSSRPDIIAYIPELGIVLYEIKDWSLDSVLRANPDMWEVDFNSSAKSVTSPYEQARRYYFTLNKSLQGRKSFTFKNGNYHGRVKVPIAPAVVFPHIKESDFISGSYDKVVDVKKCLFEDDLSLIRKADNPKETRDKIREHFTPWWPNEELSPDELNELRGVLYPEIVSVQKDRKGTKKEIILDEYQEQVARKISSGHSIIRGVAGSGKSLVLCSKALLLMRERPNWKVLITCYNISLASQIRYFVNSFKSRQKTTLDNLKIMHFHQFCGHIFRKYDKDWPQMDKEEFLSQVSSLAEDQQLAKLDERESTLLGEELREICDTEEPEKFQAILVDESQDFHPSWLRALLFFLDEKTNFLLLSEDPNQKIYPRSFSYKNTGINLLGGSRSYSLPLSYRSTQAIIVPASKLVKKSHWDEFYRKYIENEEELQAENTKSEKGGYPEIEIIGNYTDICSKIAEDIANKLQEGYKYSDIAVLYLTRKPKKSNQGTLSFAEGTNYVQVLRGQLALGKIPNFWMSENSHTKKSYDQFKEEVTISTIFSAKGLEFEIVYVVGLELYPWSKRNKRENASLLYVAMTRAKSKLYMFSTESTAYVEEIKLIINSVKNDVSNLKTI